MNKETKEEIAEILMSIYQIPGEFAIAGMIAQAFGNAMLSSTNWAWILIIFGFFCFAMEIVSPFIAGLKLYQKAFNNVKRFFNKCLRIH